MCVLIYSVLPSFGQPETNVINISPVFFTDSTLWVCSILDDPMVIGFGYKTHAEISRPFVSGLIMWLLSISSVFACCFAIMFYRLFQLFDEDDSGFIFSWRDCRDINLFLVKYT